MDDDFIFAGFASPTYTQIPDELFDQLMPFLSEAELKVLLYVCRRTFGFKKTSDAISVTQMEKGIATKDGRVLDHGTGLSRTSIRKGASGLVEKRILTVAKARSEDGDFETNVYALRFAEVGQNLTYPRSKSDPPVGQNLTLQETVGQHTELQERDRSNDSKGIIQGLSKSDEETITHYVQDLAREFADQAPLKSSATRTCRLFVESNLPLDDFLDLLQVARSRTKRYTGSIKAERVSKNGALPVKPKMAYFFGVLEDLVGVKKTQETA